MQDQLLQDEKKEFKNVTLYLLSAIAHSYDNKKQDKDPQIPLIEGKH